MWGWLHRLLFGKNGSKSKAKTNVSKGRRVPGQSTRTGSPGRSQTERRAYIHQSSSGGRGATWQRPRVYSSGTHGRYEAVRRSYSKKVTKSKPKKKERSAFEKFVDAAKKSISSGMEQSNRYQSAVDKQKAYRAAQEQKAKQEKQKARKTEEAEAKKDVLSPYRNLKKNAVLSPEALEEIKAEEKSVKKDFKKAYKKQIADDASKDLNRRLTRIGAKGLAPQHEVNKKIAKKIKKKAVAYEKKNQSKVLTTDQAMKSMAMARNSANNTKVNGKNYNKKYFSDELREQIRANIQSDYDKGSVGTGFMSGSMPVGDLKKAVGKAYGVKVDDTRARQKLGFNVAEMAGYLAKSTAFGGATEETIAKALTKVIAKKTGKQVVGKAGKFAANRAAEAIAATPVNLEDAARNSKDAKDFAKNVAINAGLDAGLGSVIDGVGTVGKAARNSQTKKIMTKLATGETMTKSEQKALSKTASKVVAKQVSKRELTATEKIVEKNMDKVKSALKRKPYNELSEINPVTRRNNVVQGRKDDKAFSDQVDKALKGELQSRDELVVGKTPQKLQKYGASDADMTMKQGAVRKTAYPAGYMDALKGVNEKKSQGHNLGVGTVKQVRKDLENPAAILKSDTQDDSFVVFTKKVDGEGRPIMAAIHLDKTGSLGTSNEVASAYGRNGYESFIAKQREQGNVLYEDKKVGLDKLPGNGLQLPELGDKSDPINTLYQSTGNVNKKAPETVNAKALTVTSDNAFQDASKNNISNIENAGKRDVQITSEENMKHGEVKKGSMNTNTGIKVGRATLIKEPYDGKVPEQKRHTPPKSIEVKVSSVSKAQRNIDEAGKNKGLLKKAYEKVFVDEGGSRTNTIKDVSYDGKPYDAFLGKKAIGKVVSDANMSPEKLAVFDNIDEIIEEAEYVGSGKYVQHGTKEKLTKRFDYFETEARIGNNDYIVSFDVEVFPNTNNYRTHKITKIDLTPTSNADVGPVPTAKETNAGLLNSSISDSQQKINIEAERVGDRVDDAEMKAASKLDSEVIIDLENDPAVRDILANSKSKSEASRGSIGHEIVKMKDHFRQKFVDSLQGLEAASKRVGGEIGSKLYHQTNALRQAGEKANYSILCKQTNFDMQVIGKGGMEILRPVMKKGQDAYDDFNAYLFHNLNVDRFKNGKSLWGEDVISPEKSRQIISQIDDKYPGFRAQADEVVQFFRNLNDVRVGGGTLSIDQKNLLEELYENFVPAFREIDKKALDRTAGGIKVNKGLYRAKGGDQAILPIHEQMAYVTQQAWKSAELNQTIKTLAEAQGLEIKDISREVLEKGATEEGLDKMLSHSTFFKEEGGRVKATYFVDGKPYETEIDKVIYNGLKEWAPKERHEILDSTIVKGIDKGLTGWNNLHKALITSYNFFFTFRNIVKDMGDALWYAESATDFVKNIPGTIKHMAAKDDMWQLWKASGGKYSGLHNMTKELNPSKFKNANPLTWVNAVNDAVEQYPRMVEFTSVLKREMKNAGITDPKKCTKGMIDKASHAGADITCNFGRAGSITKPLNRTAVPFLNASIQGADKLYRVLSGQKGIRGYVGLFAKLTAVGVVPGVAMEIMYANDEGFQDLNARDKDNYFLLKDGSGAFWAIPRARGASTVSLPAQMFTRKLLGNGELSSDEFVQKWMNDVGVVSPWDSNIFMPFINMFRGGDKALSFTSTGKTWYGGNIESRSDSDLSPIERYSAKTSKIGKTMSESMYKLIEKYGSKELAEKYTLSPKKIDHLIDSYSGIVGDVALAATQLGKTQKWYHQIFDRNMMKDPVYSNHLSEDYYNMSDELNSSKKGEPIEKTARSTMFLNNNVSLSQLRDLQNSVRMDKDMGQKEKTDLDRKIQVQINDIYRNGVDKKAIKAFDDFIKNNKDEYMNKENLTKAALREYEKVTHATAKTMDVVYKIGGLDAVLKNSSSYEDDYGDKRKLTFSNNKTAKQILKAYRKDGGKDEDFYKLYRDIKKENSERGIGTNSAYGNLAAISIRVGGFATEKRTKLRKAFGVSDDSRDMVNEYLKLGGSRKEYLEAAEVSESLCNSLRQKSTGNKYNFFAPFKARALATKKLPDRAYRIVDSAESSRRAEYYVNNSRGLEHYKISGRTLQEIDNKSSKNEKGYTTSDGLQKVLDRTNYSREEKALVWEALYGYSYKEVNPYGTIGDYSLKTDVGIDTGGSYKRYGSRGYRRYGGRYGRGYRRNGGRGSSGSSEEERSEFEKYIESLMQAQQSGSGIDEARMNYGSRKLNTKQYTSDQYRKAVARVLAKKLKA